jgi:hypothetical protein
MKQRLACLWLGVIGLLPSAIAFGENDPPRASIRVDVQMISVSPAAALSLVPALSDEKTVEEANARLQTMIANDEAKLLAWPVLWLQNGNISRNASGHLPSDPWPKPIERSRSESNLEWRYPIEFDPPQVGVWGRPSPIRPRWGEIVPTTFETLNLGPSVEAEAEVGSDGKSILLVLNAAYVRFLQFNRFAGQTSNLGISGEMVQPQFLVSSSKSQLFVRNGHLVLLNAFVIQKPEPHVELFLVRAKATLLGAVKPIPSKK